MMPASQKKLHVRGRIQRLHQIRSILTLAQADAVRIALPRRPDIVAMTEQAFVAVNILRLRDRRRHIQQRQPQSHSL